MRVNCQVSISQSTGVALKLVRNLQKIVEDRMSQKQLWKYMPKIPNWKNRWGPSPWWLTEGSDHWWGMLCHNTAQWAKRSVCINNFATVPLSSAKHSEIHDEVLTMPVVKKKTLGVCLSKIPRCISSKEFQYLMREKEGETKCKRKKRKTNSKWDKQRPRRRKCQQQAKWEKHELTIVEKAKVGVTKALAALRLKRNVNHPED